MKQLLFLVFTFLINFTLLGQYAPSIATARPGAANGSGTVGKGILQFQAGVQFDQVKDMRDSSEWYTENISENLVIRFGIRERLEISAVINHINSTEFLSESEGSVLRNGLNTSLLRIRTKVTENMAFQVGVETKIRGIDYQIDYLAPRFRLMYNTVLGENASLTTNLGGVWNGNDSKPSGFYVFSYALTLAPKLSLVAEVYGDFIRSKVNNYFDVGLGYNINKDMLVDINGGWGENFPYKSYFLTAGISYRMITKFRPSAQEPKKP